jgi:hypothetical protein
MWIFRNSNTVITSRSCIHVHDERTYTLNLTITFLIRKVNLNQFSEIHKSITVSNIVRSNWTYCS